MNKILHNKCPKKELNTLSILVISNPTFCIKLSEALHKAHNKGHYGHRISVSTAEKVSDILEFKSGIHADFIVFALDTSNQMCVKEVILNLKYMDHKFLFGRICLVNGTPYQPEDESLFSRISALRRRYNLPMINGDLMNPLKCTLVAQRILVLANATVNQEMPFLPWLFS